MASDSISFHNQHEALTQRIYETPGMLPARYVFVLTTRCNLRCDFCFQKKRPFDQAMTESQWLDVVEQLPDYARVTLTGGEPLLFPGFENIIQKVAQNHGCNLITNGLLLTKDLIDFLLSLENLRVVSISVDDVGNTLRKVAPAKWRHLERMLDYFKARREQVKSACLLDIKTTVLDENADQLFRIHQYCVEDLGCDTHAFQFLKGSPLQHADVMTDMEAIRQPVQAQVYERFDTIKDELEKVRQYASNRGIRVYLHPKAASLMSDQPLAGLDWLNFGPLKRSLFQPCKYPWSSVHINDDGNMFPCLSVPIGNVRTTPIQKIIEGEAYAAFLELIRGRGIVEACNRCGWIRHKQFAPEQNP